MYPRSFPVLAIGWAVSLAWCVCGLAEESGRTAGDNLPRGGSAWSQKNFVHPPLKCLERYTRIDEFPIVAWCFRGNHPKGRFVAGEAYAEDAKKLGFNVLIDVDRMLEPCRKVGGLKLLAVAFGPKPADLDRRYFQGEQADHPCLLGVIMDDDCRHVSPQARQLAAWLKAHHPYVVPLISKYPTPSPETDSEIRVLMSQIYPFSRGKGEKAVRGYCNECNAERKFGNRHDMCMWPIFAGGNNFNRIRFQMMAGLAYGAQGLVNFAYTPTRETTPQYHPGNPEVAQFKRMHDYIRQVVGRHLWGTRCMKVIHSRSGGEHDGAPHPEAGSLVANMSDFGLVGLLAPEAGFPALEKQADAVPEYFLWVRQADRCRHAAAARRFPHVAAGIGPGRRGARSGGRRGSPQDRARLQDPRPPCRGRGAAAACAARSGKTAGRQTRREAV